MDWALHAHVSADLGDLYNHTTCLGFGWKIEDPCISSADDEGKIACDSIALETGVPNRSQTTFSLAFRLFWASISTIVVCSAKHTLLR